MNIFQWTEQAVFEFALTIVPSTDMLTRKDFLEAVEQFKASKQPKPEWEIVSYENTAVMSDEPVEAITKRHSAWNYASVKGYPIHSVKRLSDREVFTVGDLIYHATKEYLDSAGAISRFEISGSNMQVFVGDTKYLLPEIKHKTDFLTKENQEFLADLGSGKVKLPKEEIPTAEREPTYAVRMTVGQLIKLNRLLELFTAPAAPPVGKDPGSAAFDRDRGCCQQDPEVGRGMPAASPAPRPSTSE